jgi:hypothetical protein
MLSENFLKLKIKFSSEFVKLKFFESLRASKYSLFNFSFEIDLPLKKCYHIISKDWHLINFDDKRWAFWKFNFLFLSRNSLTSKSSFFLSDLVKFNHFESLRGPKIFTTLFYFLNWLWENPVLECTSTSRCIRR